jgi:hypothetical protein
MARKNRLSLEALENRNLMAAVDYFLRLDGIDGKSTVAPEVGDPTGVPASGDLTNGDGDEPVGLLVPAVQKVREAAARLNEEGELPLTNDEGEDGILIGMLLPAVQKVREAALQGDEQLTIDSGEENGLIGLLLPAVQKVREAALVEEEGDGYTIKLEDILISSLTDGTDETALKIELENVLISSYQISGAAGDTIPTDQFALNFGKIDFDLNLDFVDQQPEAYLKYKLADCIVTS